MYYATYHGLHEWYSHCFTHLGWMILAKDKGYSNKISTYLDGISHLIDALNESIGATKDVDRVRDLNMLLHNTQILHNKAKKLLSKNKKRKSNKN